MTEITGPIDWTDDLEIFFKRIGEQSNGLHLLHKASEARFSHFRNYIDLPVIVLGVLNGATSVGSGVLFGDPKMASIIVGIVALLGAILSTISSYFKFAARSEAHRIASLQYVKLFRLIAVQMGLPRESRSPAGEFLKYVKGETDRLSEISPLLPPEVIKSMKSRFNAYKEVALPSEMNGLEMIRVYQPGDAIVSPVRSTLTLNTSPDAHI